MIFDIKTLADSLTGTIRETVENLETTPHLTIVMVGNNSASEVYVRNKVRTCESVGIKATLLHLPDSIEEKMLIEHIRELNADI